MLGFPIDGDDITDRHESLPMLTILDGMSDDNPVWLP